MEGLEASDRKKPRLSESAPTPVPAVDEDEDGMSAPGQEEPTSSATQPTEASGSSEKKKASDVNFKENPYTFLLADDPVVKTCM